MKKSWIKYVLLFSIILNFFFLFKIWRKKQTARLYKEEIINLVKEKTMNDEFYQNKLKTLSNKIAEKDSLINNFRGKKNDL